MTHLLDVRGSCTHDVNPGCSAPSEGECGDVWVRGEGGPGARPGAQDHVDHTGRNTGRTEDLTEHCSGHTRELCLLVSGVCVKVR